MLCCFTVFARTCWQVSPVQPVTLLGTLTHLVVPDDHKKTQENRVFSSLLVVRCALACVIKTQSEHVNLLELLSESASFCIGPECPSSPIRRPKKKPISSVWMTVDQPRQSNDVRKNPKRHPPLHYTVAHRLQHTSEVKLPRCLFGRAQGTMKKAPIA